MSICSISPTDDGIGVTPSFCFLGSLSYFPVVHIFQFVTTTEGSLTWTFSENSSRVGLV